MVGSIDSDVFLEAVYLIDKLLLLVLLVTLHCDYQVVLNLLSRVQNYWLLLIRLKINYVIPRE